VAGRERIYLDRIWNDFTGDPGKPTIAVSETIGLKAVVVFTPHAVLPERSGLFAREQPPLRELTHNGAGSHRASTAFPRLRANHSAAPALQLQPADRGHPEPAGAVMPVHGGMLAT
jgi:hypothetical protein